MYRIEVRKSRDCRINSGDSWGTASVMLTRCTSRISKQGCIVGIVTTMKERSHVGVMCFVMVAGE